jgi:hypothetical protein
MAGVDEVYPQLQDGAESMQLERGDEKGQRAFFHGRKGIRSLPVNTVFT